jgi:sugar lactone lactonase YvrE
VAALAYAPDGTLYLGQNNGPITVISPIGQRSQLDVSGATLQSIGGMMYANGQLYVTDNKEWGDGLGYLYAVNPSTGAAQTVLSGMDFIEDVAVAADGRIYVSDAVGADFTTNAPLGKLWEAAYDPASGSYQSHAIVTGLYYPAGIGIDHAGNVIFQQANASFAGEVYRLSVSHNGDDVNYGSPVLLAGGLSAGFDMTLDGQDNVFISGNGGIFELARDLSGDSTGSATAFDGSGFTTEVAFLPGSQPFAPFAGDDGGKLTYVPNYLDSNVAIVTPLPEPASLLLVGGTLMGLILRRR